MFTKKKDKFMVQLEEMVFNLDRAAVEFGKMDFNTHLDLKAYSDNIKTYESHGDELMHQVITDLNQTFITPIEREDILSLCNAIDDVLDAMEETSQCLKCIQLNIQMNTWRIRRKYPKSSSGNEIMLVY